VGVVAVALIVTLVGMTHRDTRVAKTGFNEALRRNVSDFVFTGSGTHRWRSSQTKSI